MDILKRMREGKLIRIEDPEYSAVSNLINEAFEIAAKLNSGCRSHAAIRFLLEKLFCKEVDYSTKINPPFYADFGKFTMIGKNVIVNFGYTS